MSKEWRCPACHAIVDYKDYERAVKQELFSCRKCNVRLVIDRKSDQPVRAKEPPGKFS